MDRLLSVLQERAAIPAVCQGLDLEAIYAAKDDRVAIEFTAEGRPGERFGYLFPARPDPADEGETPESWGTVVMARLVEAVHACDLGGFPPGEPGRTTWLPYAQ